MHANENQSGPPVGAGEIRPAPIGEELPPLISRGQEAFRRDLPQLLKERPGQWVAYHGDERIGFDSSKRALCQECLRQGLAPDVFVVRSIEPEVPREVEDLPDV
jgi:hypothetical protein